MPRIRDDRLLDWARSRVGVDPNDPKPGWWLLRAVKGGHTRVPACIVWVETVVDPDFPDNGMVGTRSPFLAAFIGRDVVDLDRVWLSVKEECTEAEWQYRMAVLTHCQEWEPSTPEATPWKPIDLMTVPLPW